MAEAEPKLRVIGLAMHTFIDEKVGISRSTWYRIVDGTHKGPNYRTGQRISTGLDWLDQEVAKAAAQPKEE